MTNMERDVIAIVCVRDTSKIHHEIEVLEMRAEHDQLTGLYNRTALISRSKKIMDDINETRHGFIIFDIDHFKNRNDNFGHSYGDDILCVVADCMKETFRSTDLLCRLGGDEFVVFMLSADRDDIVKSKCYELMENLKKVSVEQDLKFSINISIGATMSGQGEDFQEIYLRMDEALYTSKRSGRDQLTFA